MLSCWYFISCSAIRGDDEPKKNHKLSKYITSCFINVVTNTTRFSLYIYIMIISVFAKNVIKMATLNFLTLRNQMHIQFYSTAKLSTFAFVMSFHSQWILRNANFAFRTKTSNLKLITLNWALDFEAEHCEKLITSTRLAPTSVFLRPGLYNLRG